ncbi:MAG: hypothetical protein HC836_41830 [Richelia sp. RM2_1_2]|nr:hypothetical protein [Richelia sp. RM2_1_2]
MVRNNKLDIFENFQIDNTLPKYGLGTVTPVQLTGTEFNNNVFNSDITILSGAGTTSTNSFGVWNTVQPSLPVSWDGDNESNEKEVSEPKKKGLFVRWRTILEKKKVEKEKTKSDKLKTVTIVQFFSSLGRNLQDLKSLVDIAVHYEIAITNAQKAGQTALVETLKSRLEAAKSEAQLLTFDLKKYLTEKQVVDFYNQTSSDKALKLTWIKNFIKPIPSKILDAKTELDAKLVFDNYVILHYDPKNDATNLTVEEKKEIERRKKDPILFGVIKNSRRLYYIGDWIDDYCNLTLDVVIETLGDKVGEINNETVKTYIDRGYEPEGRFPNINDPTQYDELRKTHKENFYKNPRETVQKFLKPIKEEIEKITKKSTPKKAAKKKK